MSLLSDKLGSVIDKVPTQGSRCAKQALRRAKLGQFGLGNNAVVATQYCTTDGVRKRKGATCEAELCGEVTTRRISLTVS